VNPSDYKLATLTNISCAMGSAMRCTVYLTNKLLMDYYFRQFSATMRKLENNMELIGPDIIANIIQIRIFNIAPIHLN